MSRLLVLLFLASTPCCFGQAPIASPAPAQSTPPEQPRIRNFGSSLRQYEKKRRGNSQVTINQADDDVLRISTDFVVDDVLVTNQKGNVILGLQKEDFVAVEDGVPQSIQMFAPGESGTVLRSVVLIIECGGLQGPYMKTSVEAAKVLVDKLAPQDKMAIVTSDSRLRLDFTRDSGLIKKTLDSFVTSPGRKAEFSLCGDTLVIADARKDSNYNSGEFAALLVVLNEMFNEQNRQRIIIFQGEGVHAMWLKADKETPYKVSYSTLEKSGLRWSRGNPFSNFGFSEVKEAIENSGATIYSVVTGRRFLGLPKEEQLARAQLSIVERNRFFKWDKESNMTTIVRYYQYAEAERNSAGQAAMVKVAELSGGFTSFIEKPEDAANVYADIFTVMKNRYVIGYYPINRSRDGKPRQVTIQVRNHPEFTVTGRKAYILH